MQIINNIHSANFDERYQKILFIIIHYTEVPLTEAVNILCNPDRKVSAHYLISNDGAIYNLVEDKYNAWHAGTSSWLGYTGLNQYSIGIELDNLGDEPFAKNQIDSCIKLCQTLMHKYGIPSCNIIGHSDIAPDRKLDPGPFFPWEKLASEGVGIWPSRLETEDSVNVWQMLNYIGYHYPTTNAQKNAVIRSFQSHFCPNIIHDLGIDYYRDDTSKYQICDVTLDMIKSVYHHKKSQI